MMLLVLIVLAAAWNSSGRAACDEPTVAPPPGKATPAAIHWSPQRNRLLILASTDSIQILPLDGDGRPATPPKLKPAPEDTLLIWCQEINVVGRNPDAGTQEIRCSGDVLIKTTDFEAHADRMIKHGDQVVFEGTAWNPVVLWMRPCQKAKGECRLVAEQVTMDLETSRISIGDSLVLQPKEIAEKVVDRH